MVAPIIWLLGLGGLGAFALSKQHGSTPALGHLPPATRTALQNQLANQNDPAQLRLLATTARQTAALVQAHNPEGARDYAAAAAALDAKADRLSQAGGTDPIAQTLTALQQAGPQVAMAVPGLLAQTVPPGTPAPSLSTGPQQAVTYAPPMVNVSPTPPFVAPMAPPMAPPAAMPGTTVQTPMGPVSLPPFPTSFPMPGMPGSMVYQPGSLPLLTPNNPHGHPAETLRWQKFLKTQFPDFDYSSGPGTFGPHTADYTGRFQRGRQAVGYPLTVDHTVGDQTWGAAIPMGA